MHPRLAVKAVFCLQCHRCTAIIANLGRSFRCVSLNDLSGKTGIPVTAIRRGKKHSSKELTIIFVEAAALFCVLRLRSWVAASSRAVGAVSTLDITLPVPSSYIRTAVA